MTWAFEFVFGGFPIGSAAQVRAATEDYKDAVPFPNHPNAVLLLESLVHARLEIRGVPNFENGARLEKRAREEEPEEHQKIGGEKSANATPYDAPPHVVW
jgi:hypothetical protein